MSKKKTLFFPRKIRMKIEKHRILNFRDGEVEYIFSVSFLFCDTQLFPL